MGPVLTFINRMDKSAWRAVGVSAGLFLVVGLILVFGKFVLMDGASGDGLLSEVQANLIDLQDNPLGLPAVIILFCVMAFLGAPQFGLIAAVVFAFGPIQGFAYSWVATICSLTLTFWVGRWMGVETVRKYGGDTVNRLARFVGKNDFFASMIVRNVPTAPFIIVNMAFGVSYAKFERYLAGAAIGIIPKTAIVAFAGEAVRSAVEGNPLIAALAGLAMIAIWVPLMLFARRRVTEQDEVETSE